jgi:DNA polymerase (family 10)
VPTADTKTVAKLLREYAHRTALRGGNPYRSKAYSRAADSLAALAVPLDRLIEEERLTEIPGVGDAIADIITKLHRSGTHPSLEKLREEIPAGVVELLSVPGLRPEKVLRLYKDLGITSLDELEAAAQEDRIKKAKGLGAALQTRILQNLTIANSGEGRLHLHRAAFLLLHAKETLEKGQPDIRHATIAGDFRRGCELVADLALVAEAPKLEGGPAILDYSGLKIHLTDRKHFGATLLHATGSAEHLDGLRALAKQNGMRLEVDGLHKGRSLVGANEEGIYRALGLPFIEPELREGRGEIERALEGKLPKLVTDRDLHGILHCHTVASDGTETLAKMAKATRERGFQYFGVSEHSKSAHYAGGLSIERIEEQHREVDRLNKAFGNEFRILKGIESNILADGSLDYPDEVLESFDLVVAGIHGRFKLDKKSQTDRLLRAISNPHTTIIGHMTGRQLLRRPGYDIDVEKVLRALRQIWRRRGDQCASLATRPGLALASGGTRLRLHHEHKSRRSLDFRVRSHALGRRDGAQGRRARNAGPECHEAFGNHTISQTQATQARTRRLTAIGAPMPALETIKKLAEKATGWSRPEKATLIDLVRPRKPHLEELRVALLQMFRPDLMQGKFSQ